MEHLCLGRLYITQTEKNLPENVKTILEVEAKNVSQEARVSWQILTMRHLVRRPKPLIHNKGVTTQIPENISFLSYTA